MINKDDSFFVIVFGGKPGGGNESSPAGIFLGLLAIALAMIFFAALLRDAERQRQNYYPQSYSPQNYYPPTPSNSLPSIASGPVSPVLPCAQGL